MIGQTVSHYKILEKLGGGGMGVVYRAEDTRLKRTVALKFLPPDLTRDPEAKERFIHEAQAASALDHPNICNIHEVAETADGQTFIVMGCYEGQTLKKKIETGRLEINEVVDIAMQVAQGLQKAHEKEIVHRDIKPANIMITTDGVVKIVDFGLAKLSGRTLLTKSGSTLGTAAYMSPEQARGEQVDQRTDIWSLGVVLYEMLTGRKPFESDYEQALVYSILIQDSTPMKDLRADVPEALEKICRRAMAKDTKDRYQTAGELITDLESYKSGSQIAKKTRKVMNKKRRMLYTGLVTVVAVIAFGVIYYSTLKGEVFDRIAVLPFEYISNDTTGEILAYGMLVDVIGKLQQFASITVPESRTMQKYKGSQLSHAEIARENKAKALVVGSVQLINNNIHVIVKLIDPVAERLLWTDTFDGNRDDIINLQSTIAWALVKEVRVKVTQQEQDRISRPEKKVNPQAYELYLRARQEINQLSTNTSKPAWDSLMVRCQKAIDIEPDNAQYYALLAMGYEFAINASFVSSKELLPKMKAAAETAMRLDPDRAESHIAAAAVDEYQYRFESALLHLSRALELSPGNFTAHMVRGTILTVAGQFEEALVTYRKLQELDPMQFIDQGWNLGWGYYMMRRYDDAIASLKEWLHTNPKSEIGHTMLAFAYSMKGMHAEALAHNDSASYWGPFNQPLLLLKAGRRELALKAYEKSLPAQLYSGKFTWFALTGEKDSAFYWLERNYQEPDGSFFWVPNDPFLDNLRDDPRFKELLKKMNLLD